MRTSTQAGAKINRSDTWNLVKEKTMILIHCEAQVEKNKNLIK